MSDLVEPLSGETFLIEVGISGVSLVPKRGCLFAAVLSDELIDVWVQKVVAELLAVAPEMKAELRKLNETPLFGDTDA
ncbi:MAG TPA: hypothetical protein VHW05_13940 [Phenylobacterium sp.]|jgi:hypothetical protein|nr:hypothetical protein [Phenylobacterium sp.]